MPAPALVTVAVVSWNTRDLLDACLESMRADVQDGRADVWVVDNGSSDGSQALVRERHPWVTLVEPDRNLGYGPAVNEVARRTESRWVAPSNSDVRLEPGALAELVDRAEVADRTGVVGPRLILPDGSTQPAVQPFPGVGDAILRHTSVYKLHPALGRRLCLQGYWDPTAPASVDWVTGALLLVRRAAWDELGGFDAAQWMYAEDLDLCWRARRAGWDVRYEPSAVVHHELSPAAELAFGDADRRAARMLRADYDWLVRRRGRPSAWAVAGTTVAILRARQAVLTALRRVAPGRFDASWASAGRLLRRQRAGVAAWRRDAD